MINHVIHMIRPPPPPPDKLHDSPNKSSPRDPNEPIPSDIKPPIVPTLP